MQSISPNPEPSHIPYRLYRRATDNMGKPLAAADWPAFVRALREALATSAPSKNGLQAIGPYTLLPGAKRGTAGVHRVTLAALDIDRDLPDVGPLLDAIRYYELAAVVHTSPSDPGKGAPSRKVRVYMPLSRPLEPRECRLLRRVLGESLGVTVDTTTLHPSGFFYVGTITGTPPREVWEIEGMPVPVDEVLAIAPAPEPKAARAALPDPTPGDPEVMAPLIKELAEAMLPAWSNGGREGWLLQALGWLAGKRWAREERVAVIEALIELDHPGPEKAAKHLDKARRATQLDGPADVVKEALGDAFEVADAIVSKHPSLLHNVMAARAKARAPASINITPRTSKRKRKVSGWVRRTLERFCPETKGGDR